MFARELMSYTRTIGLLVTFAAGIVSIIATGGGGGSDDGIQPKPTTGTSISGIASKGPIDGGTVNAYAINPDGTKGDLKGTSTTNSDGTFTIDLDDFVGNVIIEVTGGTYTDEASNSTMTNSLMRTALTNVSGNVTAQVTPLTEMAVQIAATSTGVDVSKIDTANALVSNLIGGADILTTVPTNVLSSDASSASLAEQRYGLMLASLSQIVQDGKATDVTAAISAIAADLANNKMLNTTGSNLTMALTNFKNGGNNHASTESTDQLAALLTAYAKSTIPDQTFTMDDVAGTWNWFGLATPTAGSTNTYFVDAGATTLQNTGDYTDSCLFTSDGDCYATESGSGFTITANGFIPTLNPDPGDRNYDYMSAGKSLVASLHVATTDQWQRMSVALKRAASYSLADLEGSWVSMALQSPVAGGSTADHDFSIENIDLAADGTGTATCIANSAGCGTPSTISGISIDGKGFITVPEDPGVTEILALSADYNFIAQIGKAPYDEQINLAVRKADSYSLAELAGTWKRLAFRTPLDVDNNGVADGHYGFDVGTVIINNDGSFTYNCIDSSDSTCSTTTGTIPGIGVCNITDPLGSGESECGVVSAGKDVIVNMIINKEGEEQELSILLRRGDLASVGTTYNFADYLPTAPVGCKSTYQITGGTNAGDNITDTVTGTTSVPYTSGSLTGITSERRDNSNSLLATYIFSNDGTTARILGYNGYYLSKDCALSAPSPLWALGTMYDGMLIDQTAMTHQVNASPPGDCISEPGNQKLLIKVQDVTIGSDTYPNAIAMYTLDTDKPFSPMDFSSQAAAYGITLPASIETGDTSITDFNVYANGVGEILGSGVDASTGTVNDPYELASQTCP